MLHDEDGKERFLKLRVQYLPSETIDGTRVGVARAAYFSESLQRWKRCGHTGIFAFIYWGFKKPSGEKAKNWIRRNGNEYWAVYGHGPDKPGKKRKNDDDEEGMACDAD